MRYIIGIDLGTTNSSVSYVDSQSQNLQIHQFKIPQLVAAGYTEALTTLPSFCYLSSLEEWPKGSLALPWKEQKDFFVGRYAQTHGSKVPTRLIQSAKSWLCHAAANRREKILPFESSDEAIKISPVEASSRYLSHIKEAWNTQVAKGDHTQEFEQQEIILTVPASFDEVARRLTAEAASLAGLTHITLLEEPQAAFYSWLAQHESNWQKTLPLGSTVLVCDVGGGTTDFSLIEVTGSSERPLLQRMSVGNHLLLGGDNMDAALAHFLEPQLFQDEPSSTQWMQLKAEMRSAKEALLGMEGRDNFQVTLQGAGASIIGTTKIANISCEDLTKILLDGFFDQYPWEEALDIKKTSGMRVMGLPYENEPSISKHLARFLAQSSLDKKPKGPNFVLFNGGTMKPQLFQDAIIRSLERWFPENRITKLPSYNLDLAVSRGAAYYGKVRRGVGVRISGGSPRGYYLGLETKNVSGESIHQALTLLPRGADEGATFESENVFHLRSNVPVSFQLYTSHVRLHDKSGDLVQIDLEQLQPLPPVNTILRFGKRKQTDNSEMIPVKLAVHLNAIGILEIYLKSQKTDHVWGLEFQLKAASGQENTLSTLEKGRKDELFDRTYLDEAKNIVLETFTLSSSHKPERLMETLENQFQQPRREWPPSILRGLCDSVLKVADRRKITPAHEIRWWNLVGFLLIPGFGYPLDDFRIKELWKIILSDSKTVVSGECQVQKWICFRRCSAGYSKGQQLQLAHELLPLILNKKNKIELKGKSEFSQYAEKIRALASLELIETSMKIKIGDALVERIVSGQAISVDYWALGRIGARHLFHGSNANVVSKEICFSWIKKLIGAANLNWKEFPFLIVQLARKTDCREINFSQGMIDEVLDFFSNNENSREELPNIRKALLEVSLVSTQDQEKIFGDHLPSGLLHLVEF